MPGLAARFAALGTVGVLAALALAPVGVTAQPAAARVAPRDPVDLVLLVDVSYSMFLSNPPTKIPNDPGGIRWDAIQFLIDTAGPDDRVALVLYRADAALVTRHLDPSGFATLGSGPGSPRAKLKEMVAGFQKFEREFPPKVDGSLGYPIPGQPPVKFSGGGTGSLLALQAVWDPAWNLNFPRPGRQPWVMLFTDGMDEGAEVYDEKDRAADDKTDAKVVWGKKAFDYLAGNKPYDDAVEKGGPLPRQLGDKAIEGLTAEVAKTVALYRRAGVPVFTFGLTNPKTTSDYAKAAMRLTLSGISDGTIKDTRDPRFARLELFSEATNNVELFRQLQEVSWELREQWVLSRTGRGRSLPLTTPDRQLCDDLGVLLYRRVDGAAVAPDQTVAESPPLKSRSHHYVPVPVTGTGGSNVEATFAADADAVAVVGMRLKAPVLDQAKPERRTYTPVDAVPIQITFDPRDSKLTRDMFRAVATLRPPGAPKERALTVTLQPADWEGAPNGWSFEGSWVPEDHGRPTGDRVGGMMGDWWLDVVVSIDAKHSPLHGATRRLLRTKVTVGEYPTVTGPAGIAVVSNSGEKAGKGELRFTVSPAPIAAKDRTPPTLEAELVPGRPQSAAWKSDKPVSLGRVPVVDGVAVVPVDLTRPADFDWSAAAKDGTKASVAVRSHWARDVAIKGEVTIKKEPYALKLGSDELVFDLSGETATDSLPVMLDTRLTTTERVQLSTEKDKASDKLEVVGGDKKDKKVTFTLGKGPAAFTVPGGKNGELQIQLNRAKGQTIDPGEYTGKLYLSPADEATTLPAEVKVRVLVNQPELRLRRPRESKEPSRPLPHIRLAMLAGSKEVLPLEVALLGPGGSQEILGVKSEKPAALRLRGTDDPANKFAVPGDWFRAELNPSRFSVALEAPRSVRDGRYATEAVFNVNAQVRPGAPPVAFTVRRAVEVEVHRFAVTADADTPLYSPGPTEDRRLTLDKNKYPGSDAGLELALGTPFTDKDLVVRWWAKVIEATPPAAGGAKAEPGENWFDGRIDVRELSDSGPGQSVLGPDARTLPVSKLMEQRLVVTASKLDELTPRVYRCKVRFYGTLDGKPKADEPGVEPPHFDLPISVLVRGRIATADRQAGENKILVAVTSFGCPPGIGQLRSPDLNTPPQNIPSEVATVPDGKVLNVKPIDVAPGPGLTRYLVYWPRKWDVLSPPPGAEPPPEDTLPPVRFWRKPAFVLDRKVAAAGDKVTVRLPITPGTFDVLNKPVVARVTRNGTAVEEVPLTEDRAERVLTGTFTMPTGAPLPPAGDYKVELARELIAPDKAPTGTDVKELKPDPVVVQLGLEVRKEERALGPIIYGGGFFSSDVVTDLSLLHVTNHTLKDMRYAVQIRYPSARTFDPQELMSAKGEFTPSVHLEFKPTVLEGTLKPGETLDLGAEVGLSEDANDAYLNDRTHPTFGTKNGALMVVTMKGLGPDGQEFEWELRHPLVVETQSWRNRGILLFIVVGVAAVIAAAYAWRWWRRWLAKVNTGGDGPGPGESRPAASPPPPDPEPYSSLGSDDGPPA